MILTLKYAESFFKNLTAFKRTPAVIETEVEVPKEEVESTNTFKKEDLYLDYSEPVSSPDPVVSANIPGINYTPKQWELKKHEDLSLAIRHVENQSRQEKLIQKDLLALEQEKIVYVHQESEKLGERISQEDLRNLGTRKCLGERKSLMQCLWRGDVCTSYLEAWKSCEKNN